MMSSMTSLTSESTIDASTSVALALLLQLTSVLLLDFLAHHRLLVVDSLSHVIAV